MPAAGTSELPLTGVSGLRAHLELMRPANMVTAAVDVLTGLAVAGGAHSERVPWLIAAGVAIYGGGVTLNDFFDRHLDRVERPERPIPSGRVSAISACTTGAVLLLLGVACAFRASATSGVLAVLLAALAVAYDAAFKHILIAGPLLMGGCRGLDVLLGVSANVDALTAQWYVAAIPLAYIAGITLLSSGEVHGSNRRQVLASAATVLASAIGAVCLARPSGARIAAGVSMLGLVAWQMAPAFYRAYAEPCAANVRAAVKVGVLCLIFLDASIVAAYQDLWYALGIAALVLLPRWLARLFPVT